MSLLPSEPPPVEDSEDFTEHEAVTAILTENETDFAKKLVEELSPGHASISKQDARYTMTSRVLRRKSNILYCRVHLGCPQSPDKVLVYQINWLQRGTA